MSQEITEKETKQIATHFYGADLAVAYFSRPYNDQKFKCHRSSMEPVSVSAVVAPYRRGHSRLASRLAEETK
jgi:hypothetical protein